MLSDYKNNNLFRCLYLLRLLCPLSMTTEIFIIECWEIVKSISIYQFYLFCIRS